MNRQCVVCGRDGSDGDCHYPSDEIEATIWQRSLGAFDTTLEAIQQSCCVCFQHIPKFLELAQKQGMEMINKSKLKSNQSLSVLLLLNASTVPRADKCKQEEISKSKDDFDLDISVREYKINDSYANEEENSKNEQSPPSFKEDSGDSDATDVLLINSCQSQVTKCPCDKQHTAEIPSVEKSAANFCDCQQQLRQEMNSVVQHQQSRIRELEQLVCQQSDWQLSMQKKMDELYAKLNFASQEKY